jgi:phosphate transport system substrate-binding protein
MKKNTAILLTLALCVALVTAWSIPGRAQARNITIKGSDTMVLLGQRWAETYMKKDSGVTIQVTGGGSGVGIAALINGSTDIAESSRPMKDAEKEQVQQKRGLPAVELPVALDGLAVYVSEKNPLTEISVPQLKKIYTGVTKNWKDVGGNDERIILYGRENSSGTYVYFKEHVLENADYYPTTQTLPGTAAVINAVSKDTRGIGYGGIAYAKGVKALRVKKDDKTPGVEPTLENVQKNLYPISRFLFWYLAGQPKGQIAQLTSWVMTAEGQSVVNDVGYYPLPENVLAKYAAPAAKAKPDAKTKPEPKRKPAEKKGKQ